MQASRLRECALLGVLVSSPMLIPLRGDILHLENISQNSSKMIHGMWKRIINEKQF